MKLVASDNFIAIELVEFGPRDTPADKDFFVNVVVKAGEYAATEQAWIVFDDFQRFLDELQTLEADRKGRATLEGATPHDLRLEFYSTDSSGHMAVTGRVSGRQSERHFRELRFAFDFEPDRLSSLLQEFKRLATKSS